MILQISFFIENVLFQTHQNCLELVYKDLSYFLGHLSKCGECSAAHSIIQTILRFKLQRFNRVIDSIKLHFQEI